MKLKVDFYKVAHAQSFQGCCSPGACSLQRTPVLYSVHLYCTVYTFTVQCTPAHLVHVAGVESVLAAEEVDGELCGGAAHHLRPPLHPQPVVQHLLLQSLPQREADVTVIIMMIMMTIMIMVIMMMMMKTRPT